MFSLESQTEMLLIKQNKIHKNKILISSLFVLTHKSICNTNFALHMLNLELFGLLC